ncbi:eukaryotic translation initiation factor 3 subunit D [Mucidula mucida]|nr:eukaryotic translation initiation factor 3 subunit D [Mucidula mucida]
MSFTLPPINDAPDSPWGPPASLPSPSSIPYAPYSKADKLGRVADWNATSTTSTSAAHPTGGGKREVYGSGTGSFAYFHVEDEASFSVVDNTGRGGTVRRGGPSRGRGMHGGRGGGAHHTGRGGAQGYGGRGGGQQRGGRRGWRDWDKNSRAREASVVISPSWNMLEEIEFHRLSKLRLQVDEPDDLATYGRLYAYDKTYDRISTKSERPLQLVDRLKYNPTTSDDPVIASLAQSNVATVYTTDAILSVLMTAPRSAYPWDIVITRTPNALYLDKRDGGPFDSITVNENAADPPAPGESINGLTSLSLEATYVNQNFGFQSVMESAPPLEMEHPNPFYGGEEEGEPLASCAYRYRVYDLGVTEDEDVRVCVRTEVDAFLPQTKGLVTIRALNEFDPRAPGAGGAPDWRTKLDSQRGAVVATEMKNNSCKLAKWTVQAMLAGAEALKIGYVSRANPRDNTRHVVLSTASMRPAEFAGQLNVSVSNGWGIVRSVIDVCMKMKEGKYVLVKDPNKPVIRLYSVPMSTFTGEEEGDDDAAATGTAEEE